MTIGRILFDNRYRDPTGAAVSYSAAEVVGFEKENAIDWRDFSLFRVATGISELDVIHSTDQVIDTFSWYVKQPTNTLAFDLQFESSPAFFTTLATFSSVVGDPLIGMKTFAQVTVLAGRKVRVRFNAPLSTEDVRQVTAGTRLNFPIGQHQGIAPPNLRGEFVTTNLIGVNGSFIGRDKVRADIRGEIVLEFTRPQTFVRDVWLALMEHAERFAFFYAWNLDDFDEEVVFAWARDTPRPINAGPETKMTVRLPWSALAT